MRSSPLAEDASGVYVSPSGLNAPALSAITEKPQINCLPVMSGLDYGEQPERTILQSRTFVE